MKYVFLLYLLVGSIVDIRTQKLPVMWIYGGLMGMGSYGIYQMTEGGRNVGEILCALLPGVLCFLFAKLSKAMGEGDAYVIMMIGMGFKTMTAIQILMLAFFLAAVGSGILLVIKRNMRNRRVPFVPYIFLASVVTAMGG